MDEWIDRAATLCMGMAPGTTAEHARDLAEALAVACPDASPAHAVIVFLAAIPGGWSTRLC